MSRILIKNATIINEGKLFKGHVLIAKDLIEEILPINEIPEDCEIIEAEGQLLIPGVIDDQVHFREPGLIHKADIATESRAAVAGGVTSFMEMPNTTPQTTTQKALEEKYTIAAEKSLANYSFYIGATNDNLDELLKTDPKKVCGVKVFMGSSTGNMLVDDNETLTRIFSEVPLLIATHCEDEATIQSNTKIYKEKYGEAVPFNCHHLIRSEEACYLSSKKAVDLAKKTGAKLHLLHLTTAKELNLLDSDIPLKEKKITGEVCVHHLWFTNEDYDRYGAKIKWNPAVKTRNDRDQLRAGLINNKLDVVATDHAPHTSEEKQGSYFKAPSGGPLVQHSLVTMLEMVKKGIFTYEQVVEKMCHAPAELFSIEKRGFIKKGFKADLVLISPNEKWTVNKENIKYKCKWSPFEDQAFSHKISHTFINGNLVYTNDSFYDTIKGERLTFNR